jgi:pimeloyl-ACP methyl ester carboxylesterase
MISETDPRGFVGAAMAIRDLNFLDRLSAVQAPALIVAGRHDAAAPMPAAEAMLAALPNARLEALECAHLGNVEQPLEFTEIVGAHLERTA